HNPSIGIAFVARVLTHAIRHHLSRFRGGRHHSASRTHAEAVYRTSVAGVMHELVVRRAQCGVTRIFAQPRLVDERLGMLDPEADCERLGLHENTPVMQHAEGVASAVTERHDHMTAMDFPTVGQLHAGYPAVLDQDVADTAGKAHLSAELPDLL